jgi:hypothetical protein
MKLKEFQKLVDRDQSCLHCGETERISPNHRINRGMGGSKLLDKPSNLVLLCSEVNGLIESNSLHRDLALHYGWKLERWQVPEESPVFNTRTWKWELLDNYYNKVTIEETGQNVPK